MKVNIYYGGRGLIDDPTIFAIEKITQVFGELNLEVERYNLYEEKGSIFMLPKTLKDADGVILAASVEWLGIGGYLQQFLDACWLYADKEKMERLYMMPLVMATTYGEREAEYALIRAWEMLGGIPCEGLCAYVDNHIDFETNANYQVMIEKKAENFYRTMSKHLLAFPNSSNEVKKTVLRTNTIELTPQESEQLSEYVSNDNYVKQQKQDIEELAQMFKGMLGDTVSEDKYIADLKNHFTPDKEMKATFQISLDKEADPLVIVVDQESLDCYYGSIEQADVVAQTTEATMDKIIKGESTFQAAFMSGELSAKGNFKTLRSFDQIFRF